MPSNDTPGLRSQHFAHSDSSHFVRHSGHTLPQETRQERTTEAQQRRERLQRSLTEGPDLVIDCDFEGMMNDGELKHLCQQVRGQ